MHTIREACGVLGLDLQTDYVTNCTLDRVLYDLEFLLRYRWVCRETKGPINARKNVRLVIAQSLATQATCETSLRMWYRQRRVTPSEPRLINLSQHQQECGSRLERCWPSEVDEDDWWDSSLAASRRRSQNAQSWYNNACNMPADRTILSRWTIELTNIYDCCVRGCILSLRYQPTNDPPKGTDAKEALKVYGIFRIVILFYDRQMFYSLLKRIHFT